MYVAVRDSKSEIIRTEKTDVEFYEQFMYIFEYRNLFLYFHLDITRYVYTLFLLQSVSSFKHRPHDTLYVFLGRVPH